ncbi:hypothetical protein ACWDUN_15215, partial [Mycobacterium sp. NPDC003323]
MVPPVVQVVRAAVLQALRVVPRAAVLQALRLVALVVRVPAVRVLVERVVPAVRVLAEPAVRVPVVRVLAERVEPAERVPVVPVLLLAAARLWSMRPVSVPRLAVRQREWSTMPRRPRRVAVHRSRMRQPMPVGVARPVPEVVLRVQGARVAMARRPVLWSMPPLWPRPLSRRPSPLRLWSMEQPRPRLRQLPLSAAERLPLLPRRSAEETLPVALEVQAVAVRPVVALEVQAVAVRPVVALEVR